MGPKVLEFLVIYENELSKKIKIHISKDQNEIDGFIMAARASKDLSEPYSPVHLIQLCGIEEPTEASNGNEVS